jgi:signal transduction histidine kinase
VEATVYFCVLEALQNVQKYAQASAVVVSLRHDEQRLTVIVKDNGDGFDLATAKKGAGLTNLADRLEALGGTFTVFSTAHVGTTVTGSVPVMSHTLAAMR